FPPATRSNRGDGARRSGGASLQPLTKLCQAGGYIALRSSCPARKDICHGEVIREAISAAQFHCFPPAFERDAAFSPENTQHRGIIERDRVAKRVAHSLCGRYRLLSVSIRILPALTVPREMGEVGPAEDAYIRPSKQRQHGFRGSAV